MIAAIDLSSQAWHLFDVLLAILQPAFLLVLCGGFVLASAHLLTMFGTRWGNRRVSGKALLFSIGMHLSLACGIVAMVPEYRQRFLRADEHPFDERVQVELVSFEADVPSAEAGAGKMPVWEQLPKAQQQQVTRIERSDEFPSPQSEQPNRPEPLTSPVRPMPEIAYSPAPTNIQPQIEVQAQAPSEPAAVSLNVEEIEPQARPEVEVPSATRDRSPLAAAAADDQPIVRPQAGSADRLTPEINRSREATSLPATVDLDAEMRRAVTDDQITRREAPAPSSLAEDAGLDHPVRSPTGRSAAPSAPQIARERTRNPQSASDGETERLLPTSIPKAPGQPDHDPIASLNLNSTRMERPDLARITPDQPRSLDTLRVPATYRLRTIDQRDEAARRFGGTEESQKAVERSLRWLASIQQKDGHWDASDWGAGQAPEAVRPADRPNAGQQADAGITALAVLAFLGAGHTPQQGEHAEKVERALRWLVAQQTQDGFLGGDATPTARMDGHGMAAGAIAAAYGMQSDRAAAAWLRGPAERAVGYIVSVQLEDGGWRYEAGQPDGDMSMFGWQLMALKSAQTAGITVPSTTTDKMVEFLRRRSLGPQGGLAAYRLNENVTPAMTAEALFCKQILGLRRDNPASSEAIAFLQQNPPQRTTLNLYYWYYGTLAMFQYGGEPWRQWNEAVRDLLISEQVQQGPLAGSWEPRDPWGAYGGRIYSTTFATLCLEVYYRYLPLYQSGGRYEE